jgi:hypothetical protein
MVRGHTYYLARWAARNPSADGDPTTFCEGAHKSNEALAAALAQLYAAHRGDAERTVMDGASAWLDAQGSVQLRVVAGGVAVRVEPESTTPWAQWLSESSS